MYALNKIIGYLISPAGLFMALAAAAFLARTLGRRRMAWLAIALALVHLWLWSTPLMTRLVGASLEAEFLCAGGVPAAESLPSADLAVLHGGSMGVATNIGYRAEMWASADRVWHAARLWKAGRAPRILVTGCGAVDGTQDLLTDFGIPTNALVFADDPRNTEEEAKAVARMFERSEGSDEVRKPKVLVVTSAWHMRRTMLMYGKYAPNVEAVPAPCDFENTLGAANAPGFKYILPDPAAFMWNSVAFHEWLGCWGYALFR